MKKLPLLAFAILVTPLFATSAAAQNKLKNFITRQDITSNNALSGILLKNNKNTAATVYGLYVRSLNYVAPGEACSTVNQVYSGNVTAGAVVMPLLLQSGQSAGVGGNYLYNMLLQTFFYANIIAPPLPQPCQLPGCTWGTDFTTYNWCITLGALAPVSVTPDYTSTVPPSGYDASDTGYNYNLINSYILLGPITCSDTTLTCTMATAQTQSFS